MICGFLFAVAGCTKNTTLTSQENDDSTISSTTTQSSNDNVMDSSTPTNSKGDSSTDLLGNPTNETSTTASSNPIDGGSTASPTTNNTGDDKNMDNNCKLIVKGKDITSGNHVSLNYENRYAELPLTVVMKELGAKVEWQGQTTAKITFGGKDYTLDTIKGTLVEVGGTFNVLMVAPGTTHGIFYQVIGEEFIIDSDSAKMLIINMMGAKISIDYDKKIVSIG
jgi:hypothetical protein